MDNGLSIYTIAKCFELNHSSPEEQKILFEILNTIEAVVCVKNIDGEYVFVNDCYLKTLGANAIDIIGKKDSEIFQTSPETPSQLEKLMSMSD
ncbi:hypothetical protein L9W80_18455 [Vibrio aestuarianus]|uniref:hypothetical protein n=1 Tax=Vibrio aestuarianus TaxID=28171 RepID=UPI00237C863E|nr:hypothetical protein [Vibrio aestuarianus]MDE1352121.1 hypothetical protein [Vibrio aestuarianus]